MDDSKSLHKRWLFHQTSIYKWLFRVPLVLHGGSNLRPFVVWPPDSDVRYPMLGPRCPRGWISTTVGVSRHDNVTFNLTVVRWRFPHESSHLFWHLDLEPETETIFCGCFSWMMNQIFTLKKWLLHQNVWSSRIFHRKLELGNFSSSESVNLELEMLKGEHLLEFSTDFVDNVFTLLLRWLQK